MQYLQEFIKEPYNPIVNYNLARQYEELNQTAAAASFYLRAAEKTNNVLLQYISLIRNAMCFNRQGNRDLTVKTLLQRAISIIPNRPEGYFLLARLHEARKEYHDGYAISCIGLNTSFNESIINEYPGRYGLMFLKAVCGWWVGLTEESREITFDLHFNYAMNDEYKSAVQNNVNNIGFPKHKFIYNNSLVNELKYKFNNIEKIKTNYSQVYQDLFVLTLLDGKEQGTYLELGSNDPFYNSNTALLETVFNWEGISIEIDQSQVNEFTAKRRNKCICDDALNIDYDKLLSNFNIIDYLQIDCDPAEISFSVLKKILDTNTRFKIITFEHDFYLNHSVKHPSREYLKSKGYVLLVNDVAFNNHNSFEDWWVDPAIIKTDKFSNLNKDVNFVQELFFE
jgi:hypothetical protein